MRSCWAPLRVLKLRSNVPDVRSSPDAAMKKSANSREISRGSAPKIGRVAAAAMFAKAFPPVELRRTQSPNDWASRPAAPGAVCGASTGTCSDIESSRGTMSSRSVSAAGSGGAKPVGPSGA